MESQLGLGPLSPFHLTRKPPPVSLIWRRVSRLIKVRSRGAKLMDQMVAHMYAACIRETIKWHLWWPYTHRKTGRSAIWVSEVRWRWRRRWRWQWRWSGRQRHTCQAIARKLICNLNAKFFGVNCKIVGQVCVVLDNLWKLWPISNWFFWLLFG